LRCRSLTDSLKRISLSCFVASGRGIGVSGVGGRFERYEMRRKKNEAMTRAS
jgi:hypothetical protein